MLACTTHADSRATRFARRYGRCAHNRHAYRRAAIPPSTHRITPLVREYPAGPSIPCLCLAWPSSALTAASDDSVRCALQQRLRIQASIASGSVTSLIVGGAGWRLEHLLGGDTLHALRCLRFATASSKVRRRRRRRVRVCHMQAAYAHARTLHTRAYRGAPPVSRHGISPHICPPAVTPSTGTAHCPPQGSSSTTRCLRAVHVRDVPVHVAARWSLRATAGCVPWHPIAWLTARCCGGPPSVCMARPCVRICS